MRPAASVRQIMRLRRGSDETSPCPQWHDDTGLSAIYRPTRVGL